MTRVVLMCVAACWPSRAEQGDKLNGTFVGLHPFNKYVTIVSCHGDVSRRTTVVFSSTTCFRFGPTSHQNHDDTPRRPCSAARPPDMPESHAAVSKPFSGYGVRVVVLKTKCPFYQRISCKYFGFQYNIYVGIFPVNLPN